jgi:hypothetical protein
LVTCNTCALVGFCVYLPLCGFHDSGAWGGETWRIFSVSPWMRSSSNFRNWRIRARPSISDIPWSVWSSSLCWRCSPVPVGRREGGEYRLFEGGLAGENDHLGRGQGPERWRREEHHVHREAGEGLTGRCVPRSDQNSRGVLGAECHAGHATRSDLADRGHVLIDPLVSERRWGRPRSYAS